MHRPSLFGAGLAGVLAVCAAAPALAAGSGSMGSMGGGDMGGVPSQAPQYDPVQEYQAGVSALAAQNFRQARTNFQRVVDAQPRQANAWFMLGQAKAGLNDWRGARSAYQRAVSLDGAQIAPHRELGVAASRLRDANTANAQLAWLQQKQTECAGACAEAAELTAAIAAVQAAQAGAAPSAQATHETLILASSQDGDAAYLTAVSLINQHRYRDALAALDTAERAFGPHPDVLTYQGFVWRHLGDPARAADYYQRALAVAPNHVGATEYYGELMVLNGDTAGARAMLARLDRLCAYGCIEADTLRRWIDHGGDPAA
jgi:tetratricopeptide (TPR) repeat protein